MRIKGVSTQEIPGNVSNPASWEQETFFKKTIEKKTISQLGKEQFVENTE